MSPRAAIFRQPLAFLKVQVLRIPIPALEVAAAALAEVPQADHRAPSGRSGRPTFTGRAHESEAMTSAANRTTAGRRRDGGQPEARARRTTHLI